MTARARFLSFYFAAWVPLAAMYAVLVAQRSDSLSGIQSGVTTIGFAAVLGLLSRALGRRVRLGDRGRVFVVLWHLGVGAAYSTTWTSLVAFLVWFFAPVDDWQSFARNALGWQFLSGLLLYAVLTAAFEAIDAESRRRDQARRAVDTEALRVKAELGAMRAQLNPHFLFNALHSITALVRSDPRAAERALERFGLLMRRVLDLQRDQRDEIALAEELEFVHAYLELETMRYGDRIAVREEVEPDALECLVLAFSIQPLVENAIRHGLAPLASGGTICIGASLTDEALSLEVADDGIGFDATRVTPGVGLGVVRQRLSTRHGSAAHMDVTTAPNEGCRVRVVLPIVLEGGRASVRSLALYG